MFYLLFQGFRTLLFGKSLSIDFDSQDFSVAKTDVMPNWYIAAEGFKAVNINTTYGEDLKFVGKFDTKEKWKRSKDDMYDPFTPAERWKRIKVEKNRPELGSIIPTPIEMKVKGEQYVDISNWVIVTSAEYENEAMYLGEKLKLSVRNNTGGTSTKIVRLIQKNVDVKIDGQSSKSKERYEVDVNENTITISAPESSGIFYGIQSLIAVSNVERKQVLMVSVFSLFSPRGVGSRGSAPNIQYRGPKCLSLRQKNLGIKHKAPQNGFQETLFHTPLYKRIEIY